MSCRSVQSFLMSRRYSGLRREVQVHQLDAVDLQLLGAHAEQLDEIDPPGAERRRGTTRSCIRASLDVLRDLLILRERLDAAEARAPETFCVLAARARCASRPAAATARICLSMTAW